MIKDLKKVLFIVVLLLINVYSFSQYSLSGFIMFFDTYYDNFPLRDKQISIIELNKYALTDNFGKFKIDSLQKGTYTLQINEQEGYPYLGIIIKNIRINTNTTLDTIFYTSFYFPLRDITLSSFYSVRELKDYYKDKGSFAHDTSKYNLYSFGFYAGKSETLLGDSVWHFYRQGEWKWDDRTAYFEKGLFNGPTSGYNLKCDCGFNGYYKNDKLNGLWEFYNLKTKEFYQVEFQNNYLVIDFDTNIIEKLKKLNILLKRIPEIYSGRK